MQLHQCCSVAIQAHLYIFRYGLSIANHTRYLTIFFMVLFFPVAYPFSKFLGFLVGFEGPDVFDRKALRALIAVQKDPRKKQGI